MKSVNFRLRDRHFRHSHTVCMYPGDRGGVFGENSYVGEKCQFPVEGTVIFAIHTPYVVSKGISGDRGGVFAENSYVGEKCQFQPEGPSFSPFTHHITILCHITESISRICIWFVSLMSTYEHQRPSRLIMSRSRMLNTKASICEEWRHLFIVTQSNARSVDVTC